jgi:hypothetical protein
MHLYEFGGSRFALGGEGVVAFLFISVEERDRESGGERERTREGK